MHRQGQGTSPYELGVKVSVATPLHRSKGGQFIADVKALPGNSYDGHTLETVITEIEAQVGAVRSALAGQVARDPLDVARAAVRRNADVGDLHDVSLNKAPDGGLATSPFYAGDKGFKLFSAARSFRIRPLGPRRLPIPDDALTDGSPASVEEVAFCRIEP